MNWTTDQIADLTRLRAEGQTSSEIAAVIGISRNAVIGKASRLGLPLPNDTKPRYRPVSRAPRHPRPKLQADDDRRLTQLFRRPPAIPLEPLTIEEPPQPPEFLALTLLDLERNQCHYPRGEGADIRFCGQPVKRGSYCGHCYRIMYVVGRPNRRKPFVQLGWGSA